MTPRMSALSAAFALIAVLAAGTPASAEARRVAVSIPPLHSLVAGVMAGIGTPDLILRSGSPHGYVMRPSDARALARARVVFLVHPRFEAFLARSLAAGGGETRIVSLASAPGVRTVEARRGGAWESGEHDHEHGPNEAGTDWHLWLHPANARAIVIHAGHVLAEEDPANARRYAANAERMRARIDVLEAELRQRLAPVTDLRYIVFHDAYHYFEDAFGLYPAGAVTVSPDRQPGIRRVRAVRQAVEAAGARCVFAEPQFEPALVRTILEDTGARAGTLDPLGAALPPGPDAWFTLMRDLADSLRSCLLAKE